MSDVEIIADDEWYVCSCLHRSDYHAIKPDGSCCSCNCKAYDGPTSPPASGWIRVRNETGRDITLDQP